MRGIGSGQAAALILLAGAAATRAEPIRVCTYNIRSGSGTETTRLPFLPAFFYPHGHKYLDRIAAKLADAEVDVVALQEVQARNLYSMLIDQPRYLAGKLGFEHRTGVAVSVGFGALSRMGNALLSRYPILESRSVILNEGKGRVEPRSLLLCRIQAPGHPDGLWVGSTHLESRESAVRLVQLEAARAAIARLDGEVLVMGDFNARPESEEIRRVLTGGLGKDLADAASAGGGVGMPTFPSRAPKARIDYIFHTAGLSPAGVRVLEQSPLDSDHLAVVADLEVRSPAIPAVVLADIPTRDESIPTLLGLELR